jgi:hypothetical protein
MSGVLIYTSGCDCAPGQCVSFVEPSWRCVERLQTRLAKRGVVVMTKKCPNHPGYSWHAGDTCLSCRGRRRGWRR